MKSKIFSLWWCPNFHLSPLDCAFGITCYKNNPYLIQRHFRFSHIFSSGSFISLGFTFWSVIHSEWIFTHDVKTCTEFFFSACEYIIVPAFFVEKSYPLFTDLLCTLWKISFPCICGSTSSDLLCSIDLHVYVNINVTLHWLL